MHKDEEKSIENDKVSAEAQEVAAANPDVTEGEEANPEVTEGEGEANAEETTEEKPTSPSNEDIEKMLGPGSFDNFFTSG